MTMPAILDRESFATAHHKQRRKLHKLILTNTGWDALYDEAAKNLKQGDALSLKATNVEARIAFAETMHEEFSGYLARNPELRIFWVTIAPSGTMISLSGNHFKAIRQLRQNLFRFREFDYWGLIDLGYFPRGGFNGTGEKTVSWHAHLFVWVKSDAQANAFVNKINDMNRQNVHKMPLGLSAVDFVEHRLEAILKRVWYACKAPLRQYSIISNRSGGSKIQKAELRPGQAAELHNILWDTYIDDLCVGRGEGSVLLKIVIEQVKRKLAMAESERQKQLRLLAGNV